MTRRGAKSRGVKPPLKDDIYRGALAEPLPAWPWLLDLEIPSFASAEKQDAADQSGQTPTLPRVIMRLMEVLSVHTPERLAHWRAFVSKARTDADDMRVRTWSALLSHYGVDGSLPGAGQRLARKLANAHIDGFSRNPSSCTRLLLMHYEIDMHGPPDDWELARKLAARYVPAFQMERSIKAHYSRWAYKPTGLDVEGTVLFLLRLLMEKYIEDEYIRDFVNVLTDSLANKVDARTLNAYEHQLRAAMEDYYAGRATDFQRQVVEEALPQLFAWVVEFARRRTVV